MDIMPIWYIQLSLLKYSYINFSKNIYTSTTLHFIKIPESDKMVPVFIKLKGFKVCIFGFGEVGRRRLDKIIYGEPEKITLYTKEEVDRETKKYYEDICNIQSPSSHLSKPKNTHLKTL